MELATTAHSGTIVAKNTSKSNSPAIRNYRRFLPNLFASTLQTWHYTFAPAKILPPDVVGLDLSRDEIKGLNMLVMLDEKRPMWKNNLMASAPFVLLSIISALITIFFNAEYNSFITIISIGIAVTALLIALSISVLSAQGDINNNIITNAWPIKLKKAINNLNIRCIDVPYIIRNVLRVLSSGSETIDIIVFRKLGSRDSLAMMRIADMLLSRSESIDTLTIDGETSELLSRVHSAIENSSFPPPSVNLKLSAMDGL